MRLRVIVIYMPSPTFEINRLCPWNLWHYTDTHSIHSILSILEKVLLGKLTESSKSFRLAFLILSDIEPILHYRLCSLAILQIWSAKIAEMNMMWTSGNLDPMNGDIRLLTAFSDTTAFALKRWEDAVNTAVQSLQSLAGKSQEAYL
jgi:hypothetical protein